MKKIVYAVMATLSGLVLLFSYRTSLGESVPVAAAAESVGSTAGSSTAAPASSGLQDGTFTGDSVSTRFGPVQVQITVSGGTVTAVDVPVYPSENNRDRQINERAIPQLVSEALQAQSASIDMVSGATYTSNGYRQSLQSALDEASQ